MSKIIINGWIEKDEYGEDVSYINDIPIHDILTDKIIELGISTNDSLCYNEEDDRKISINTMVDMYLCKYMYLIKKLH